MHDAGHDTVDSVSATNQGFQQKAIGKVLKSTEFQFSYFFIENGKEFKHKFPDALHSTFQSEKKNYFHPFTDRPNRQQM